eukprot:CAMPEP_0179160376 /NCGR_PEP_ID=MMETSP0796-20121207/78400_1 /TAXON_ID=73915 /ORGANISM="Pyrodinium bahamense, Strain pbaha01" /LENGTH=75 /DNA_ID=CAMNT_0020862289 /DNA_START=68 /DNA_END=292 /DNA_ORIENTATION=-
MSQSSGPPSARFRRAALASERHAWIATTAGGMGRPAPPLLANTPSARPAGHSNERRGVLAQADSRMQLTGRCPLA